MSRGRFRRFLLMLCALALCLSVFEGALGDGEQQLEIVSSYPYTTVTTAKVNLRAGRSVRSTLLRRIPAGAEIVVRGKNGSWAEVDYGKYSGYVKTDYIVLKEVKKIVVTPTPTPAPTPNPEEDAGEYKILQEGDSGAEVKALQAALIELGYLSGTPDGVFGKGTSNAVIAMQQKNEYPATGIVDANLQAFLYSGKPKNASGVATKVSTLSPVKGATMKRGVSGDPVKELQTRLYDLGYYQGGISGLYDLATARAVQSFQKKNGLKSDGVAGMETQNALFSETALSADATPTPKVTPTPTATAPLDPPLTVVHPNDTGSDAKKVQQRLKDLQYYRGQVDGKFGNASVRALKSFQEDHGLEADGVAGNATIAILFSENVLGKNQTPTPEPIETPASEAGTALSVQATAASASSSSSSVVWTTLRKGDEGDTVKQLQEALIQLGYLSGKPDGKYGAQTVAAVKAFQKNNNLKSDGAAGEKTQKALFSGTAKAASAVATTAASGSSAKATATPKATTKATPSPTPGTLKQGDKGDEVRALQNKLIELGYLTGKADGVFGQKTLAAVVAFQKANKLSADGVAGAKTLSKLDSASPATTAAATATSTPVPQAITLTSRPSAARVQYANWYTTVKALARKYPYATVYDFTTGISYQIHMFSLGAHADYEPLTANDTAKMLKIFGKNTWNPRAVWVVFADGSVYLGSTHSNPHDTQHITDNNFPGHSCLHFPRTQAQVEAIGPYATSHQQTIDQGWATTQAMK